MLVSPKRRGPLGQRKHGGVTYSLRVLPQTPLWHLSSAVLASPSSQESQLPASHGLRATRVLPAHRFAPLHMRTPSRMSLHGVLAT
jgi:hypothetical protein